MRPRRSVKRKCRRNGKGWLPDRLSFNPTRYIENLENCTPIEKNTI